MFKKKNCSKRGPVGKGFFVVKSVSPKMEVFVFFPKLRKPSFDPDGNCDIMSFTCWFIIKKYHQTSWDATPPSWKMKVHDWNNRGDLESWMLKKHQ